MIDVFKIKKDVDLKISDIIEKVNKNYILHINYTGMVHLELSKTISEYDFVITALAVDIISLCKFIKTDIGNRNIIEFKIKKEYLKRYMAGPKELTILTTDAFRQNMFNYSATNFFEDLYSSIK